MRSAYTILLGIFSVYLMLFCFHSAQAQVNSPVLLEAPKPLGDIRLLRREPDIEAFKPVGERTPPDLQPVPVRWRGFVISPMLESTQYVNTNIFATSSNEEIDTITTLKPSVFVTKNFGRHQANLAVSGEARKYWSNQDEDVFNFNTKVSGYLEARREIKIPFEISYASGHEKRGQNFAANFSKEPISFSSFGAALGISYDPNRLNLALVGRYGGLSFDDGTTAAGQTVVRRDGDRNFTDLELSASYEILPNHRPFISVNLRTTDYERGNFNGINFSGAERDSTNFDVLAGWELAYKGLLEGYLGIGYGERDYDDNSIEDIDSFRVSSNINWNVTKKATLNLGLRRAITEDNQVLQGMILSQGHLQLDYEFLHNLFYNAFLDYSLADFQGSSREDDIFATGTGLRYVLSPRFSLSGEYDFKSRDSSALGLDFDRHQFMVRLHTRF